MANRFKYLTMLAMVCTAKQLAGALSLRYRPAPREWLRLAIGSLDERTEPDCRIQCSLNGLNKINIRGRQVMVEYDVQINKGGQMTKAGFLKSVFASSRSISVATSVVFILSLFNTQLRAQIPAFGKTSQPIYGGTTGLPLPRANPFSANKGAFGAAHTTSNGQACIAVHPSVSPQRPNPQIVNHQVLVVNACGQTIKLLVCYYQTSNCINVSVGGYQKLERTLGVAPASMADFRYEYREIL